MSPEQADLWRKLNAYSFETSEASTTFLSRLARENQWSDDFATRVLREYRRFLLLAMSAGHVVCPSEEVDQAWHLHLIDTRAYQDLCENVLGKTLHHTPSRGGHAEEKKYRALYAATLQSYQHSFKEDPPRDIWPNVTERFAEKNMVRVDLKQHWLVPRPRPGRALFGGVIVSLALLATGCGRDVFLTVGGPWDLKGPQFLLLYVSLSAAVGLIVLLGRFWTRRPGPVSLDETETLDPYEMAYLAGYRPRAIQAAIASLLQGRYLDFNPLAFWQIRPREALPSNAHWFEFEVYDYVKDTGIISYSNIRWSGRLRERSDKLDDSLIQRGLLVSSGKALWLRTWTAGLFVLLGCFGFSKIQVGLARQKPVEFLVILCIATALAALACFFWPTRLTPRGRGLLRQLREKHAAYQRTQITPHTPRDRVAAAVALFGSAVLSGTALAKVPEQFLQGPPNSSSSIDGGCSGGGGGGGGGCGGGGGGSGCGGCGGG